MTTAALGLFLAGCASATGGPSAANAAEDAPASRNTPAPVARVSPEAVAQAAKPSGSFGTTVVGQKVATFRADFDKLKSNTQTRYAQLESVRAQTVTNVQNYQALVAGIRSRLQMG